MPIIINGGSRSAGWWWAGHLQSAKNEKVEIIEIVGLSADNIPDAFREMYALARGSKCTNYFYEYDINPRADEHLTDKQWDEAHEMTRQNLGHADQPYFRVRHTKPDGRIHEHGISFRVDLEQMKAIPDSLTARIHEQTSRELEQKFGLEPGRSILVADRDFERPARRAKKWERFRGAQNGIDPHDLGKELAALKQRSDNGQSFKAGLEAAGYGLARGDRRDFVVIDQAGDDHSLTRRLGMKAAALREYMKDVDPASLPDVKEAKARQAERTAQTTRQIEAARAEAEMHAAARGRTDDTRPVPEAGNPSRDFSAAAARATEPVAPNFDRDAADAAWMSAVDAAAIAKAEAAREPVHEAVETEKHAGAAEAPEPATTRATGDERESEPSLTAAPAERHELHSPGNIAQRILGGIGEALSSFIAELADFFSPPPPPTKDQAERMERVAEERQEQAAWQRSPEEQEAAFQALQEQMRRDDAQARQDRYTGRSRDDDDDEYERERGRGRDR